jgi:hypothetical protein
MIFAIDFLLCFAMTLFNYFFDVRACSPVPSLGSPSLYLITARSCVQISHLAVAQQIVPEGRTFMATVGIFFSYTALLNYLIPLSLVVTIEMDRFFQVRSSLTRLIVDEDTVSLTY